MDCFKKHEVFQEFKEEAKDLFSKSLVKYENDIYGKNYMIKVCPGGWDGGCDINRVDISYGSRPIGQMIVRDQNDAFANTRIKLEADRGAWMMIYHYGNGRTLISIMPANTERQKRSESEIVLYYLANPKKLKNKWFIKRLLRILKSYMAITCCIGVPSIIDWLRVLWIKITRTKIVDGCTIQPYYSRAILRFLSFFFQVGFSGFVVVLVLQKIFTNTVI